MTWLALLIALVVAYLAGRSPGASQAGRPPPRVAGRPRRKSCRWTRLDPAKRGFVPYRCETCGVTAYGRGDHEPTLCKRDSASPGGP